MLPTEGQTGFKSRISTPGGWRAMNLITAAGDVTGDRHGDVLGRSTENRPHPCLPWRRRRPCQGGRDQRDQAVQGGQPGRGGRRLEPRRPPGRPHAHQDQRMALPGAGHRQRSVRRAEAVEQVLGPVLLHGCGGRPQRGHASRHRRSPSRHPAWSCRASPRVLSEPGSGEAASAASTTRSSAVPATSTVTPPAMSWCDPPRPAGGHPHGQDQPRLRARTWLVHRHSRSAPALERTDDRAGKSRRGRHQCDRPEARRDPEQRPHQHKWHAAHQPPRSRRLAAAQRRATGTATARATSSPARDRDNTEAASWPGRRHVRRWCPDEQGLVAR